MPRPKEAELQVGGGIVEGIVEGRAKGDGLGSKRGGRLRERQEG